MRKGHRRTQSAYIAGSTQPSQNPQTSRIYGNEIVRLLEASQNKVASKVINYERLEVNSLQENNYLKFGNFTIEKIGFKNTGNKIEIQPNNLNCIPENSKSSELSSQKLQKDGGNKQDDIPVMPVRKVKQKRASDFKRLEIQRNQKCISQAECYGKRSKFGKSLKKR